MRAAAAKAVRNSTGGFLVEGSQEIMVRNLGMTTDLGKIGRTTVAHVRDRPITIEDVAEVVWDVAPMRGDAGMGLAGEEGSLGVILSVRKSPGYDTLALTGEVETALEELQAGLPEGLELLTLYRQADYIQIAIGNLEEALRDGALMVALVLLLFLLNIRVTAITLTAIPLSLAIAVVVFDLMEIGVNSMTLGGLAVAIGMVVDDAIVDVENVFRRLRENAAKEEPLPRLEVIARASAEVRSSIFYATVLIILVFLPLLSLSGVEGRLFTPIALATITSMAASFLVSLTVIPVLSSLFLHPKPGSGRADTFFVRWLKEGFRRTGLRLALAQPWVVLVATLFLLVGSGWLYAKMGGNFLPPFREPSLVVATTMAPGTSLKTTTEMAQRATELVLQIEGVKSLGYRVGRAERGDHVVPVSTVEFDIEFQDLSTSERGEVVEAVRETMRGLPGTFSALSGPLADRIGHMLSGVSAKVAIKIFGPELRELRRLGEEIAGVARAIPGLEEARTEQQAPVPQLRIEVDRDRALAYGVQPGELNAQLATLLGGEVVSEMYEGARVYDLVVRLAPAWRENPERLEELYIDTLSGQQVPLSAVANLRPASGPNTILRENTRRRFVVSINPLRENLTEAVEELQAAVLREVDLPEGYAISFEGEYQAQQEASQTIFWTSGAVLLVIVLLLSSYFRSLPLALLVLTILPVSLVGAIVLTQQMLNNVSIATLVGFIAIAGISARNNIMLLSHYLHLMQQEGESFGREMVERGTLERLVPVLMTALSAGFALMPMLLASEDPGKEILQPVAVVIVGGLLSSTLLGLIVTPSLFFAFFEKSSRAALRRRSGHFF